MIAESCLAVGQVALLLRAERIRVPLAAPLTIAVAGVAGASPLLVAGVHPLLRTLSGLAIFAAVIALFGRLPPELRHALARGRRESADGNQPANLAGP